MATSFIKLRHMITYIWCGVQISHLKANMMHIFIVQLNFKGESRKGNDKVTTLMKHLLNTWRFELCAYIAQMLENIYLDYAKKSETQCKKLTDLFFTAEFFWGVSKNICWITNQVANPIWRYSTKLGKSKQHSLASRTMDKYIFPAFLFLCRELLSIDDFSQEFIAGRKAQNAGTKQQIIYCSNQANQNSACVYSMCFEMLLLNCVKVIADRIHRTQSKIWQQK